MRRSQNPVEPDPEDPAQLPMFDPEVDSIELDDDDDLDDEDDIDDSFFEGLDDEDDEDVDA